MIVAIVVGLVFSLAGVLVLLTSPLYSKRAVALQAMITGMEERRGSKGGRLYAAVFEYTFGNAVVKAASSSASSIKPKIGKIVTIKIMPDKPENPTTTHVFNYMLPWILITIGVLIIAISIGTGI